MASTYFVAPSSEQAIAVAQNVGRLNQEIAILIRETATKNNTKQEIFYFIASKSGDLIHFKNEKKLLKELTIDLEYGIKFDPKDKNGKLQFNLVLLLGEISRYAHMINTSLGLTWLHVAFEVYSKVYARGISATEYEVVKASLQDWMDAINSNYLLPEQKLEIGSWLLNTSRIGNRLNISHRKTLENFVKSLEPVVTPQVKTTVAHTVETNELTEVTP
ncbi:hypothetical protein FD724_14165 [Nostoc sp. C057]|uniref:hypothetical protein n=1 Tax=Nostoc sp. C057 TaxID=2576903 RepID=UPI0015C3AF63|nr:hypothetical protein [Nostoc sp. C057]QLE49134.1 hypothetical protein FD724_14165 [Nostoc sp. C057]